MKQEDCEKWIIGAIKIDQNIIDDHELTESLFLNSTCRQIFIILKKLHDQGKKIDDLIFNDAISNNQDIKFSDYMDMNAHSSANVKHYIDIQTEYVRKKRLQLLPAYIKDWTRELESHEILQKIDSYITNIDKEEKDNNVKIGNLLYSAFSRYEEAFKRGGDLKGISTGFESLDNIINGLCNQDLIIIASRPSIGKTSFAVKMATNIAKNDIPVGFFELESSKNSLVDRMFSFETKINLASLRSGRIKTRDFASLQDGAGVIDKLPIYINDTPNHEIYKLISNIKKLKRKGVKIIFIDHLTLINLNKLKIKNKNEAVGESSKMLKTLARELDIPIVVLSQVTRGREGNRPTIADLTWSGDIEQNADVIMLLHRDRSNTSDNTNVLTELNVAKDREGPVGKVNLMFEGQFTSYRELNSSEIENFRGADND